MTTAVFVATAAIVAVLTTVIVDFEAVAVSGISFSSYVAGTSGLPGSFTTSISFFWFATTSTLYVPTTAFDAAVAITSTPPFVAAHVNVVPEAAF